MVVPTRISPFNSVSPSASIVRFDRGTELPMASRSVTPPVPTVVKMSACELSVVPSILPVISMLSPAHVVWISRLSARTTPSLITIGLADVTSAVKVVVPPEPLIRNTPPGVEPSTVTVFTKVVSWASMRKLLAASASPTCTVLPNRAVSALTSSVRRFIPVPTVLRKSTRPFSASTSRTLPVAPALTSASKTTSPSWLPMSAAAPSTSIAVVTVTSPSLASAVPLNSMLLVPVNVTAPPETRLFTSSTSTALRSTAPA